MTDLITTTNDFFQTGSTIQIAKEMLGHKLTYHSEQGLLSGIIVETEAYLGPDDMAAHSYGGRHSEANDPLYQQGGTIYIYSIHSWLDMDISIQKKGLPNGVLIRGIEPIDGKDIMDLNRKKTDFDTTNGPAKWIRAFGIMDKELSGTMLNSANFQFELKKSKTPANILETPRIGVPNKGEWTDKKMRFIVDGNPYVSKMYKRDMNLETYGWK
ncbi:DNA-3-methyladenine glycosylase [Companilactobacillus sp.]|uniref:DNA-3-methyladenine glycosylase n=1 Tax=Companilactobacillus sp. TaxID=2767905 RepID=UPI0025BDA8FB|nr:DNA-3-methyladenine glycosylase [Companilactobacillus sp.]MCH4007906.1 DNA-3-methyladenine glycosylase [Companilactobacillus sp.]MCH4051915.1 DNA-3-methyladenine glycosylase [Companilactobacillus sp.]MCH4075849.1 DNA-3-methyladenine glycosylase [Companilactobacillus sp.]MCH4124424.1 DNA-3-methyladenine glycosylase [Companilactobacillus sp.]MCH4132613.1 DNA-3-methyladenine glycosylase [Companilactobacillus sp.]